MNEGELKGMKIHDIKMVGSFEILRVAGGWIYWYMDKEETGRHESVSITSSGVFVPERN